MKGFENTHLETQRRKDIAIENAGLVLVAPFLTDLFKELNIFEGERLTDECTAVLSMQYAATGIPEPYKYERVLPKILCGPFVSAEIDTHPGLSEDQRALVDGMISSLIEHWPDLGGTSVQGFRESFLKRNGKLTQEGGFLILHVEQRSVDVLLDRLPWSISIIKLPWMKDILRTEWM